MNTSLSRIWRLTESGRARYGLAFLFLVLAAIFTFLVPLIGKTTIDAIIRPETEKISETTLRIIDLLGGKPWISENLWIAAIILLGVTGGRAVFLYLRDRGVALASETIIRKLRDRLFEHLHNLPCRFFSSHETGDIIQRCTSDVETARLFFGKQLMELARAAIFILVAIPILFGINTKLAIIVTLFLPPIIGFSSFFFSRVKNVFQIADEAEGALTSVLQENLTGTRVVRAFGRQRFECDKFQISNKRYKEAGTQLIRVIALYWGVSGALCFFQLGVVLFVGGLMVINGQLTVGSLYAFLNIVGFLVFTIRELGRTLSDTGKAMVSLERIYEILSAEVETIDEKKISFPMNDIQGEVAFENVSFKYNEGQDVIRDISFKINPGETVVILGPSGSGKSTLIRLLLRLYDYQKGSIAIDGTDLKEIPRKEIRQFIGTSLQESFLFAKTLRSNIKLSNPLATDEEMFFATDTAKAHETILSLSHQYDTMIGERGVTLSGGQRQRVTLSRTLLKGPSILLLDDSLSAVDSGTERRILSALSSRHQKQTVLIVSHRLTCCLVADRILVMEKGKLTQSGTHQQLVKEPGLYRDLWQIQKDTNYQSEGFQDERSTA